MDSIPPELVTKIISSPALSTKDLHNLSRTNQLLRYAALPKLWNYLHIWAVEANFLLLSYGGAKLNERRLKIFLNELPHLHAFVESIAIDLNRNGNTRDKETFQRSLTGLLRILADLLPSLPTLRDFQWEEGQFGSLGQEGRAAALSILVALLRSEVTRIKVFGSLLSFLTKPLAAEAILQSQVERVCFSNDSLEHDAIEQMAALSYAPKLAWLDIRCSPLIGLRRGLGPDTPSPVLADGFWGRLTHLTVTCPQPPVWKFILDSAQSFKTNRSDGSGLALHELVIRRIPSSLLDTSITSLSTPSLFSLQMFVDFADLGEDTIGLIGTSFPNLTQLILKSEPGTRNPEGHSVVRLARGFAQFHHLEILKFEGVLRNDSRDGEVFSPGADPRKDLELALTKRMDDSGQIEIAKACLSLRRIENDEFGRWDITRDARGFTKLHLKLKIGPDEHVPGILLAH